MKLLNYANAESLLTQYYYSGTSSRKYKFALKHFLKGMDFRQQVVKCWNLVPQVIIETIPTDKKINYANSRTINI